MNNEKDPCASARRRLTRARILAATVAGAAFVWQNQPWQRAVAARALTCDESVQDILNAALAAERLATTFYYHALRSGGIVRSHRLAGLSGNITAVASDGDAENVAYLQAALDQEQKHAQLLTNAGATTPFDQFYFPAATFDTLGSQREEGTWLWVVDHLETAFIGAYLAAINRFGVLGHPELALLAARIVAVECEHRALYRVISGDDPADNLTLEVAEFTCVGEAVQVLLPYFTGRGFHRRAPVPLRMPTPAQTAWLIGTNHST